MHQPQRVRGILTQPIPLIRAFLLCLLLLGSQLATFAGFFSYAEAAGYAHGGIRPQAISKTAHPVVVSHLANASTHTAVSQVKSSNALKSVRPNIAGKHHAAQALTPDIALNVLGPSNVTIGVPATYTFTASNLASAAPLLALPTPLIATITLPTGFTGVTASATSGWSFITSGTLITATYTGPLPINPGDTLPAITVTATPTASLLGLPVNLQTVIGTIVAPGDLNLSNNTVSVSLTVANTGTATPTATSVVPTVTSVVPTVTSVVATATSVVPTVTSVVPTATAGAGSINATLDKVVAGASTYSIGQTVTYDLIVSTADNSAPIPAGTPIQVEDVVPLGLSNIVANSTTSGAWSFAVSSATSPSDVIATYTGAYPIAPGTTLATITVSGTINSSILPTFTNTADLFIPNNVGGSTSTFTISIPGATGTPVAGTATPVATATAGVTPIATATGTVTTGTVTATATGTATTGTVTATATGTATTGTVTATATGTATTSNKPQLFISESDSNAGATYHVGDTVTFTMTVTNMPGAASETQPISLQDVAQAGLTNVTYAGNGWTFNNPGVTTSPFLLTATYAGTYPVAGGTTLPPVTLTGVLTSDAVPTYTNTAVVSSSDDPNPALNTAVDTISVSPLLGTQLPGTAVATGTAVTSCSPLVPGPVAATATALPITPVSGLPGTPGVPTSFGSPVATSGNCEAPDLSIVKTTLEGDKYHVGDKITFILVVSNVPGAGTVYDPSTISVEDVLPLGLNSISVHGDYWHVDTADHNSPTIIDAHFTGKAPVNGGAILPSLVITGVLTKDAIPTFTDTAYVDVPGDVNTNNNIATYTVSVKKADSDNGGGSGNGHGNGNGNGHGNGNGNNNNNNNNNHQHHHCPCPPPPPVHCPCPPIGPGPGIGVGPGVGAGAGVPSLPLTGADPYADVEK